MDAKKKYLIFRVENETYAVLASEIREIVTGLPQFPVPFVPRWVRGVLNRHGDPYIVLDVKTLLGGEPLSSDSCILLNRSDDLIAVLMSEVVEFIELGDGDVHQIASPDDDTAFFSGSLRDGEKEIFILALSRILEKMADDVSRS
jgi:chemotaxis signal transduction protein